MREERRLPEQANYQSWKKEQLASYARLDTPDGLWHLPDGRSLRVVSEQPRSGEVSVLYEDVSEKIQLESRYNELIGVQRETIDNMHEGLALFGTDGCLKLFNPTFGRFWQLNEAFLDTRPHVVEVFQECALLCKPPLPLPGGEEPKLDWRQRCSSVSSPPGRGRGGPKGR